MIRLTPGAIYTLAEARKILGKDRKTFRKYAERVGIPPFAQFFTDEQIKRMATSWGAR